MINMLEFDERLVVDVRYEAIDGMISSPSSRWLIKVGGREGESEKEGKKGD